MINASGMRSDASLHARHPEDMGIYLMKNQPEEVSRRFAECYVGDVIISAITFNERDFAAYPSLIVENWLKH